MHGTEDGGLVAEALGSRGKRSPPSFLPGNPAPALPTSAYHFPNTLLRLQLSPIRPPSSPQDRAQTRQLGSDLVPIDFYCLPSRPCPAAPKQHGPVLQPIPVLCTCCCLFGLSSSPDNSNRQPPLGSPPGQVPPPLAQLDLLPSRVPQATSVPGLPPFHQTGSPPRQPPLQLLRQHKGGPRRPRRSP